MFFDGVGIAPPDDRVNPVSQYINRPFPVSEIEYDFHGGVLCPTDATLGLPGLPQSATGQATILTGQNAAKVAGRHVNAFPTTALRQLISERSLLKYIKDRGGRPVFANAYHAGYFGRRHSRFSVSTWSWLAAGIDYHNLNDLHRGTAVSHDLTNRFMNRFGFGVPVRRSMQSGRILASLLGKHDFVFFEYILTDVIGHRQDISAAHFRLAQIKEMMIALLLEIDLQRHTIVLVSDHGNLEDLSTNTHNRNKVPTIIWGKHSHTLAKSVKSLTDIMPVVLKSIFG